MFKKLLILSLLILLMPQAFAKSELVLNLDNPINVQLLPTSQYYLDAKKSYDLSSIGDLAGPEWNRFNREQFKFGFTSGFVWVKTTFRTIGNSSQDIAIKLHSSMDTQQIKITNTTNIPYLH